MAVVPRPPQTHAELVDAYELTARAVIALARAVPAGSEGLATPCPGWSVTDQVAHVESAEAAFAGEQIVPVDTTALAHVRSRFGAAIESLVISRRGRTISDLADALEAHIDARVAALHAGLDPAAEAAGPFGPMTVSELVGIRLFDIWCHEQDLRETLGLPGGLDSAGAAYAVGRLVAAWPRIVAKAGLGVGEAAALVVTGPVQAQTRARVEWVEGKPRGVADAEHPVPSSDPVVTLTLDTRSATRLVAGRTPVGEARTVERLVVGGDFPYAVAGDPALGARLAAAMAITP